jgi:hypothetical protein
MIAPQLLDRTELLVRARNRIDTELARTVRRGELVQAPEHDGLPSMASWLRGHLRLSRAQRTSWCATAARWSSCRRWPRPAPRESSPPSRWRCSPRSPVVRQCTSWCNWIDDGETSLENLAHR